MGKLRYMAVIERGDASWGAHVPDLPGCVAIGETEDEVRRLIREAIEFHSDGLGEDGLPVPAPTSEGEFVEVGAASRSAHLELASRDGVPTSEVLWPTTVGHCDGTRR